MTDLLTRCDVALHADPSRVVARLFVPGHELLSDQESRATGVLSRVLGTTEVTAQAVLADVRARFTARHRDLPGLLDASFRQVAHRVPDLASVDQDHRELVGAVFTNEYAVEGAALFNPSAVEHPDQSGLAEGQLRFLLSLRAVGEGHISSVEFRSGVLGPGSAVRLDPVPPTAETAPASETHYTRDLFVDVLVETGADTESTRFLEGALPERFDADELEGALRSLAGQSVTRHGGVHTAELARRAARCAYEVEFPPETSLGERVLWPEGPTETNGIEDVRLVRSTEPTGGDRRDDLATYRGTYTAFDGEHIAPQLLETEDFRRFRMSQLSGPAAKDKGLALFPRRVGGLHLALSRSDRETLGLASSVDGRRWGAPEPLYGPTRPWEVIQTGNCGSPVETSAGWVVLTHGVGPFREYAIGALLLHLDDPGTVLGALREPLLAPTEGEREGYVPNVVYSCGAVLAGDRLLLPYGASDASVRFAVVDVPRLLDRLLADGPPDTTASNSSA